MPLVNRRPLRHFRFHFPTRPQDTRPLPASPAPLPAVPQDLRRTLLAWYDAARRDLPWRAKPGEVADPWAVLVSEIMLQQTTVATVGRRFAAFLARFPTAEAMAEAPLDDVLHAWQGLGYYRRARSLHAAARAITERHGGRLPGAAAALEALPGIGAYTGAAVAAIAFGEAVVPIDGNVARVLARLLAHETPLTPTKAEFRPAASALATRERAADLAQALMELGALVCTPRRPACARCPWQFACRAHGSGLAEQLPRKTPKAVRPTRYGTAMLIADGRGRLCFKKRPETGLLAGLIELPTGPWRELPFTSEADLLSGLPAAAWRPLPGAVRHVFTHFALELVLVEGRPSRPIEGGFFHPRDRLHELALPTLTKKLLRHARVVG
jgi:A/G-specific adenine glycosylase